MTVRHTVLNVPGITIHIHVSVQLTLTVNLRKQLQYPWVTDLSTQIIYIISTLSFPTRRTFLEDSHASGAGPRDERLSARCLHVDTAAPGQPLTSHWRKCHHLQKRKGGAMMLLVLWVHAVGYADDVALLVPSPSALHIVLHHCAST